MKIRFALILLAALFTGSLYAQNSGVGVGIKLGEPTGITAKYWLNNANALSGTLGYSLLREDQRIYLSVDYLYHSYNLVKSEESFPVYYGFGVRLLAQKHEDGSFGVRGVGGISWIPKNAPIDVFVEFAPVFRLLPSTGLELDASLGARYYF